MTLTTILGSLGCSLDLIGAFWIARSFVTATTCHMAEGATQCWGYNPYIVRERCRQAADAKVGAAFMIIGFILNIFAWYTAWLWPGISFKIWVLYGIALFNIIPIGCSWFIATKISAYLERKYYKAANSIVVTGS